jgi:hypothetical protein
MRVVIRVISYKTANISNGIIDMKNKMTLKNFVMKTDTKFRENLSRNSLAEMLDPAGENDPHHTVLVYAEYRRMIYRGADKSLILPGRKQATVKKF